MQPELQIEALVLAPVLRRATPEDLPALIELERAVFPDAWSENSLAQTLNDAHYVVWLAERESEICGYGAAWTMGDEGELSRLAVVEKRRGQGIGAELLRALAEECRKRGAIRLFLEVREGNAAARALYEKTGFKQVGLRPRYYADDENAVIMARELL